jgi:diguanylate cyclase (GGDEF)-like protein/PAS domain S-box-containing protein
MDSIDYPGEIEKLKQARDEALRAARSAVRDASRVNRILTVLSEPEPLEHLLEKLLTTVSELFSSDIVVLLDPSGTGSYYPVASVGIPEDYELEAAPKGYIAPLFKMFHVGTVLDQEVIQTNPVLHEVSQVLGVEEAAWIPMKGSPELRGALILARCTPSPFTRQELDLLTAMAYRISLTLDQIKNTNQLKHIIQGNQNIGHHLEELAIGEEAVQTFPVIVGADAAVLYRCKDDFDIICTSVPEKIPNDAPQWPLWAKLLSNDQTILLGEAVSTTNSDQSRFPADSADFQYRAVLAAPMFRDGQLHSLLCAFRINAIDFTEETKQMATLYSGQIAAAQENAHLYSALRDELRERLSIEASLRESETRFKALLKNISDVIAVLNSDGTIKYVGEVAARTLWGRTTEDLVGTSLFDRVHSDNLKTITAVIEDALKKPGENISAIVRMRDGDTDTWRYFDIVLTNLLHDSSVNGIVSTFHDVTETKIFEKELTELAFRDPLTGLSNRAHFLGQVRLSLKLASDQSTSAAIIFFDLDNFKYVNDKFGHAAGDETLRTIAERVEGCLRSNDIAARLGGDEFTILIENIKDHNLLLPILDRLLATLMEPIWLNGIEVNVGGSIGIAISVMNDDAESLLRKADLAMYRAKNSGKGRYVIYNPSFERPVKLEIGCKVDEQSL